MVAKIVEDFYIRKRSKFMGTFDEHLAVVNEELYKKFDNKKSEELISQMKVEFEKILPNIPYIGGQKNPTTLVLVKCMSDLAIFRILEKAGFSFREIGEFHYNYVIAAHKLRKEALEKAGRDPSQYPFDPVYINYQKKLTEETQMKLYPDDWVMDFVEGGDGKNFEWGWDITECGVQKAYKKLGEEKYLPFICLGDYYEAEALGFGFSRDQTLGFGAPLCTHRFVKDYKTPRAWPPDDLEEFNTEFFQEK
ncbi:MAG: L-2-amino-thiazoline-4-carboxylic acid hydrolase [Candidatus Lokiarchaeota archaeon]|nr:L-2-amino-thiazoline-4-carboxylic acid hydrolase [Candidatus Lokiarchaeota archaeon]